MGVFQKIIDWHKEKVKQRNDKCNDFIAYMDMALTEYSRIFADAHAFVEPKFVGVWYARHGALIRDLENVQGIKRADNYKLFLAKREQLYYANNSLKQQIAAHNGRVAEERIQNGYNLVGNVEGRMLDRQQMICIVKEAHNHLVIAGAGTGKTTTVVGKIKYLLRSGKYKPEDMLVLSFTNASASEMSDRIRKETGCKIEASTFHKLGLNIITKVNGIVPKITRLELHSFVKDQLKKNMESDDYLRLLSNYLLHSSVAAKSEFDFQNKEEYEEYLRLNPPTTLNNETVKSYGEMDIANFLAQNGIAYIYEQPYEIDTRTSEYGQYYPDFYLPDYHIYIEYFGVNKNGEVPAYFKGKNGMTATESYQASMEWKRNLHAENNTVMLSCFAYEKLEGNLQENLKKQLLEQGVVLQPKSSQELWQQVERDDKTVLDGIIDLFVTVTNLIKSNGYTFDEVMQKNAGNKNAYNNEMLLVLLEPIFFAYNEYLREHEEIDFNDIINLATQYVTLQKYVNPYKCVIVDEYQDISKARYLLLKSMRQSNDFELFCVGDDWQSIYRFAGSDIGYILNFERFWGATEISKIETTYRFTKSLIEISGSFIMQNPAQIKKAIKGQLQDNAFALGEISGYTDKAVIRFMVERLDDLPKGSSVFFIGRYSFDKDLLDECGVLQCRYDNVRQTVKVTYEKRKDLDMQFVTAHKSKGLQADYVFIINNKKSRMGFPSKVQDAPILELLLENSDAYPYAEERRLFYVALTRARKKAYLLTVQGQESQFAMELKKAYGEKLKKERFTCPWCGGQVIKKNGKYGEFWGCSNYRKTGCRYTKNIKGGKTV